jgi:hypothetical protein
VKYDEKKMLKILQEQVSEQLYAASRESPEAYEAAIGEVEAWLEGHKMHQQELREEAEEGA